MSGPVREQWLVLERIALAVVGLLALSSLLSRAIHWDWLMDTLFLVAAVLLVVQGPRGPTATAADQSRWPLLLCGYLCVDSVFLFLVNLRGFGVLTLLYLVLGALYGRALQLRATGSMPRSGASLSSTVFSPASRAVSLLCLLAMCCMALPMTQVFRGFTAWSGPMVVTFHTATVMNAGHAVHIGGVVALVGYQIALGHPVFLLLLWMLLLPLLRATGVVRAGQGNWLLRGPVVAVLVWWVFFAQGFQSLLGFPATLVFVAAIVALTVLSFRKTASMAVEAR